MLFMTWLSEHNSVQMIFRNRNDNFNKLQTTEHKIPDITKVFNHQTT